MVKSANPREVIGGNFPPPDEDENDQPTLEEARLVFATIAYVQFKCPHLGPELMLKKKGKLKLGWRHVVFYLLEDRVRQVALAFLLKFKRKTTGESQHRPEVWAAMDPEFDNMLAGLRHAVEADAQVNIAELEAKLKHFVSIDPDLRKMEEAQREHEAAALELDRVADELEARKTKRIRNAKTSLAHLPRTVAQRLSEEALDVLEKLAKAEAKRIHPRASALNAAGLAECVKADVAQDAEPHLSKAIDRQHAMTKFGARVAEQAYLLELIAPPKKKRAAA